MTRLRRWTLPSALLLSVVSLPALAQDPAPAADPPRGPDYVSKPVVPTITPAVRDLPDFKPDPNLFGLEMKRRDDYGFLPIPYAIEPKVDPLLDQQRKSAGTEHAAGFGSLIHNYPGQSSSVSPPDTTGDVGPTYFLQAVNQSVSTIEVIDKATGANVKTFTLQSLTSVSPCNSGFCDPVVLFDRQAGRWLISELPRSSGNVCVYVSTTGDPTGTWYAYSFATESSNYTDYAKYGVWPQGNGGGSYLIGANAGSAGVRDVFALDRAKMLAGMPATFQKFSVPSLPNSGFQLVLPGTTQSSAPPPDGEPAIFMRPHDDEAQNGASTPGYDFLDMWSLSVDWATPANSTLTTLPPVQIGDYDMTLCGLGTTWNCMPQPGTSQKIDPIREPLHFPLQYRNFGDHQTLVGTFPEDVDGTDHAALRWFELRKTGAGAWTLFQEGLVGGEAGVHRSVGSIAMDGSGNIALGYTRTGGSTPYYPSIYYSGRLASDAPGTMPQGENVIVDATSSRTLNERWGDYAGMGIDPVDDCTFWFTTEFGGSGNTKVSAFKFDACGCLAVPPAPAASASAPQDNRIDVSWDDSSAASITQYLIFRATTPGGPYSQVGTVADSSPGTAYGPSYTYHDDAVSGGTRYYYVVKSSDGVSCTSASSNEVDALATGQCRFAPTFAGLVSVDNPSAAPCTLNLGWSAAASACGNPVVYDVYRDTSAGFTPSSMNRIATGVAGTSFSDQTGIATGTTYYFVVRALDVGNGIEESNSIRKSAAPTGLPSSASWTDTFEGSASGGGFDQPGWTHEAINGTTDWAWSTTTQHDGTHSWFAADVGTVSDKVLTSPPFGVGPSTTLGFYHTFRFQGNGTTCSDGGTLEYTKDAGANWAVVPDADFISSGGFNGTVSSNGGNPIAGKRAWCRGTIGTMSLVTINLGGDANLLNQLIQVRWHEGDDQSLSSTGWYVDTVALSNAQVPGNCTTGSGTLIVSNNGPICSGSALQLTASWSSGGVTYSWTGPNGFTSTQQNPSIPGATSASAGTYFASVLSGGTPIDSDSTQVAVDPAPGRPDGLVFGDTTQLSWGPATSAAGYDLVRGTLSTLRSAGFSAATDACDANDLAGTSFNETHVPAAGEGDWYLVRAEGPCGGGSYDDGSPSQAGSRDSGIASSSNTCP
jgi:hypothetical protein